MKKTPLQSVTIKGALITLLAGAFQSLDIDFDVAYLTEITNALVMLTGFAMTIYGRFKATSKISLK